MIMDRIKQWDQGNCSHGNIRGDTHRHFLVRSDQLIELARIKNFFKIVKPKKSIRTLVGNIFGVLVWVQDESY